MRKPVRNLLVAATAGMLTFGGLAIAGPAASGSWGGHPSCSGKDKVNASGMRAYAGDGSITVQVPGKSVTNTERRVVIIKLFSNSSSGSWSVYGPGAFQGGGWCG